MITTVLAYLIFIAAFVMYYKGAWIMGSDFKKLSMLINKIFKLDRDYLVAKERLLAKLNQSCKCNKGACNDGK